MRNNPNRRLVRVLALVAAMIFLIANFRQITADAATTLTTATVVTFVVALVFAETKGVRE